MVGMRSYKVNGMTCEGCVRSLTNAIQRSRPEAVVQVDLPTGTVTVGGIESDDSIRRAVEQAGFEYGGPVPAG
jgi:copper chaperone